MLYTKDLVPLPDRGKKGKKERKNAHCTIEVKVYVYNG